MNEETKDFKLKADNPKGHYHPLTIVTRDMERIFSDMGFEIVQGPEIEDEYC